MNHWANRIRQQERRLIERESVTLHCLHWDIQPASYLRTAWLLIDYSNVPGIRQQKVQGYTQEQQWQLEQDY